MRTSGATSCGHQRRVRCRGFTLLEVVVTMGVLGTLVAIVAPAVQVSRSRVRDLECRNNLRQIGLALQNHEQSHKAFPTTGSYQLRLSAQIENSESVWVCPADSQASVARGGDFSYLINDGTKFRFAEKNGFAVQSIRDLADHGPRDTKASDITDGLSNTCAYAERLLVSGFNEGSPEQSLLSSPRRFLWYVEDRQPDEDGMMAACESSRTTPYPLRYKTSGTFMNVGYDHILPPNRIGCQNGGPALLRMADQSSSLVSSTSEHGPSVNVLMADGAVRPIFDSIDLAIWRAISTRAGNEVVSLD
ncbi:MAG: DUF1559 domain-containing protein [Planctomyces sp.]|nr:DUF1559 domain-containing protein [Planctomyces sp.]